MRRRGAAAGVAIEDVPDWVLHFDYDRYLDQVPLRSQQPVIPWETREAWHPGMVRSMEMHRLHREEAFAWREEHAPHLSWHELRAEERRRFPVVDRAAR